MSRTYQLASGRRSDQGPMHAAIDPDNELLWRFNRRRLDAESIRDTLLALGGNLDRSPGGPHPFPPQTDVGLHAAQAVQGRLRHRTAAAST